MILRKTRAFTQSNVTRRTNISCVTSSSIFSTINTRFLWPFLLFSCRYLRWKMLAITIPRQFFWLDIGKMFIILFIFQRFKLLIIFETLTIINLINTILFVKIIAVVNDIRHLNSSRSRFIRWWNTTFRAFSFYEEFLFARDNGRRLICIWPFLLSR